MTKEGYDDKFRRLADQALYRLGVRSDTKPPTGTFLNPTPNPIQDLLSPRESGQTILSIAIDKILRVEGKYTVDSGGPTMRGITIPFFNARASRYNLPKFNRNDPNIKQKMISTITKDLAIRIYSDYWEDLGCGNIARQGLPITAFSYFDIAINAGPDNSIRYYRSIFGIRAKDRLPRQYSRDEDRAFSLRMQDMIHSYRMGLARNSPNTYGGYKEGWTRRYNLVRQWIKTISPID